MAPAINGGMTTTIDMSRLPRPTVLEPVAYQTFLDEMIAAVRADMPDLVLSEADPVMKTLRIAAGFRMLDRQAFNDDAVSRLLAYATGADLDHLGALVGVARLILTDADPETNTPAVMEDDDTFRERIANGTEAFSVAGPEGAYKSHARAAHPDVLDVSATSPAAGEVVITVLSRQGDGTASPEVQAAVTARLSAEDVRPMTDQVTVRSATIIPYAVNASYRVEAGPDASVVDADMMRRGLAYAEEQKRVGRNITTDGWIAALRVAGISKLTLIGPAADIDVSDLHAAHCTGITLTPLGVGE